MTYYELLQVQPEASTEVIEASWRALMKKFHPDKHKGNAEVAKKLNQAHDVLSDPKKRAEYDLQMHGAYRMPGESPGEFQYRQAQQSNPSQRAYGRRRRGYPEAYPSPPRRSFSEDQIQTDEIGDGLIEQLVQNIATAGQMSLMDFLTHLNEEAIKTKTIDKDPVLRALFGRGR